MRLMNENDFDSDVVVKAEDALRALLEHTGVKTPIARMLAGSYITHLIEERIYVINKKIEDSEGYVSEE